MGRAGADGGGQPGMGLHLRVEYPDIQSFLTDYRENIIHGSTFVSSRRKWSVGDRLTITFSFPGLITPISAPGKVSWTQSGADPGVGVELAFHEHQRAKALLVQRAEAVEKGDPEVVARLVRVLLAEDNPVICEMLSEGLVKHASRGPRVPAAFVFHLAYDGAEAMQIIEDKPIDLLIAEISLPVLDGKTLIRSCRELFGVQFPIIAISGGGEDAGRIAKRSGADVFLRKPLRLADVFTSMSQLLCLEPA